MSKELLTVVETVANEKGIPQEALFKALEQAISAAVKKKGQLGTDLYVKIDRKKGDFQTFRCWSVVETVTDAKTQWDLEKARALNPQASIGQVLEESIETVAFDRVTTQLAKQVIIQKVKDAERQALADKFLAYEGKIISGSVKKVGKVALIVDLGQGAEGWLPRTNLIAKETYRVGDHVRAWLGAIEAEGPGPQFLLSRVANEMLIELLKIEIPEIADQVVEIKAAVREPGSRAKVAVCARDQRVDPIGACVGMRGSRIQAVSNELRGERIDIILWDENIAKFAIHAMAPAEVTSVLIDEDERRIDLAVEASTFAQAIGRGGQNVRLASDLVGWSISVLEEKAFAEQSQTNDEQAEAAWVELLGVDQSTAHALLDEGFSTLESLAYLPESEWDTIEALDLEHVKALSAQANRLLIERQTSQLNVFQNDLSTALAKKQISLSEEVLTGLIDLGIDTLEKLADQSVDELSGIQALSREELGAYIMAARESCWF